MPDEARCSLCGQVGLHACEGALRLEKWLEDRQKLWQRACLAAIINPRAIGQISVAYDADWLVNEWEKRFPRPGALTGKPDA